MKLLYLSAHESLEVDELKIFDDLGLQTFSVGHYTDPKNPKGSTKSGINLKNYLYEYIDEFNTLHPNILEPISENDKIKQGSVYVHKIKKSFLDKFDVLYSVNYQENITLNNFSGQKILRCIGQPTLHLHDEKSFNIAYSESENQINPFTKFDTTIYPYIDNTNIEPWVGGGDFVFTINKWMKKRGWFSCYDTYERVTSKFNRKLCGFGNSDINWAEQDSSFELINNLRKTCGVYFSTITKPGPFTYSLIEAMAAGCPIVSIGPLLGSWSQKEKTFLAHKFIRNGENGFVSDAEDELVHYIQLLLQDQSLRTKLSENIKKTYKKLFSYESALNKWRYIFNEKLHIL